MITPKKYKLKLNSVEKIEELLQELYNESCKNIQEVQNEMNKLSNSVNLNDEIVDAKAKYAKAINDFITNKDKAIGRKLEIAKVMSEVLKFNGNVEKTMNEGGSIADVETLKEMLAEEENKTKNKKEEYILK